MITINDVTLRFGTQTLFQNVNLKFVNNECYGIVGANGAGKSTFLKLINGDIETTHGEIIIPKNERVSMLEQDHYKYDEYTVIDVVIMGNKKLYDIKEEVCLNVDINKYLGMEEYETGICHYFKVKYQGGEPILGGEEKENNNPDNYYEVVLIDMKDIDTIFIYGQGIEMIKKAYSMNK